MFYHPSVALLASHQEGSLLSAFTYNFVLSDYGTTEEKPPPSAYFGCITSKPSCIFRFVNAWLLRFIAPNEHEHAELVVQEGPEGFDFKYAQTYVFKYSFQAKEGMRVSGSSVRLGQMKAFANGYQMGGDPLFSITANNDGVNVRFANLEEDLVEGMGEFLIWEGATGEWVHVGINTTFGISMEVRFDVLYFEACLPPFRSFPQHMVPLSRLTPS